MKFASVVVPLMALVAPLHGLRHGGKLRSDASPSFVCNITSALPLRTGSFVLSNDNVLDNSSNDRNSSTKLEELATAKKAFLAQKAIYQEAEARLMAAMDALLEVQSIDGTDLVDMLAESRPDTVVVFYAPWCPHCQSFVLHDGHGNPVDAPLEIFRRDLLAQNKTRNIEVARLNVASDAALNIPKQFSVQGIPMVYFVSKTGSAVPFKGNPHNLTALKSFVSEHASA
eukprot:TRINITY_DN16435_c1_g1_i1.p1 TRINITY_DN16435_c1_g1~~TRINITY_DN16435_c1_g1_i1.p1  ORF type:complete len:228 (+),score=51.53 TRINITY_DN16435_c1_g1_i1:56-739(+)